MKRGLEELSLLWLSLDWDCKNFLREREREEGKRGGGEVCGGLHTGLSVLKAEWEADHTWKSARIWRTERCSHCPPSRSERQKAGWCDSSLLVFLSMRTLWLCEFGISYHCLIDGPRLLMEQELGAGSQDREEVPTSTSASSSNSDLPSNPQPEGERAAVGRRHSSRTFTGLRLFGRRWVENTPKECVMSSS